MGSALRNGVVAQMTERLGRTAAQVILRWHLNAGRVVIPKSITPSRIAENYTVTSFELSTEDIAAIDNLDTGKLLGWDPENSTCLTASDTSRQAPRQPADAPIATEAAAIWPGHEVKDGTLKRAGFVCAAFSFAVISTACTNELPGASGGATPRTSSTSGEAQVLASGLEAPGSITFPG